MDQGNLLTEKSSNGFVYIGGPIVGMVRTGNNLSQINYSFDE